MHTMANQAPAGLMGSGGVHGTHKIHGGYKKLAASNGSTEEDRVACAEGICTHATPG